MLNVLIAAVLWDGSGGLRAVCIMEKSHISSPDLMVRLLFTERDHADAFVHGDKIFLGHQITAKTPLSLLFSRWSGALTVQVSPSC